MYILVYISSKDDIRYFNKCFKELNLLKFFLLLKLLRQFFGVLWWPRVVSNHCSIQFLTPYQVLDNVQSCVIAKNNLEHTLSLIPWEWIFSCYHAKCIYGDCVGMPWMVTRVTYSHYDLDVKEGRQQTQVSKVRVQ